MTKTPEMKTEKTPAMSLRFWSIVAIVFFALLWILKPMLLPFVLGAAIAYFLNPILEKLPALRVPRWLGALLVLLTFILLVVLLMLLIVPLIQSQMTMLIDALPTYIETLRARFMPRITNWMHRLSPNDVEKLREAAGQYAGSAVGLAGGFLKDIVQRGFALFDILTLFVITPVVAFYLLRDWPKVTQKIDMLIPRQQHTFIRQLLADINRALSGFMRGQALVCLCLGLIYGTGLTLVGLNYGATIGIIAGVLSFIPYVGSTFGLVASMILAFIQFDDNLSIGLVLAVFLVVQALEGYVLTPKLVGDRVGLHPVWILFALFAGGTLLGFLGVFIAVPVAAIVGVLIRASVRRYKQSGYYERKKPKEPTPKDKT